MLFKRIKNFFKRLFGKKAPPEKPSTSCEKEIIDVKEAEENLQKLKIHNIVLEKLNYLEQYIKIFSLQFPNEYLNYLQSIHNEREAYETELKKYSNGLLGELTFAIDPECESARLISVCNLEKEITNFVELVVNYTIYKDKFSKLCSKLNEFYNALLDTTRAKSLIISQINNATNSLSNLVSQVTELRFFQEDTRKKDEFLNCILYCEYIIFKSSLRCQLTYDLDSYKNNVSKFHNLYIDSEYNNIVFKFLIEDLEQYQDYITSKLVNDSAYPHLIATCQNLQNNSNCYNLGLGNVSFCEEIIKFENTIDNISDNNGVEFKFALPSFIKANYCFEKNIRVKDTAISVLSMLNTTKANILCDVLKNFKYEISWKELYFLCKIFELYDDVIKVSLNTIFSFLHTKLLELAKKYPEYSEEFIKAEKQKLLRYSGSKKKKYVFLLSGKSTTLPIILDELRILGLDFYVNGYDIYLNHAYFNGFKNLEVNFGQYKFMEEIQ